MRLDIENQLCSVLKSDLTSQNVSLDFDTIDKQCKNRRVQLARRFSLTLQANRALARQIHAFSHDGSLRIGKDFFEATAPEFFKKSRRSILYGNYYYLRGGRYTISNNPTFEMRQKLNSLIEDFDEGLSSISSIREGAYQLGVADHVKNSVLTLFNSFLYNEKIGNYRFTDKLYQDLRVDGSKLAEAAVEFFYGQYVGRKDLTLRGYNYLKIHRKTLTRLRKHILKSYEDGVFSSRHMTRSEASHPGINLANAMYYAEGSKLNPTLILGLPAGSTELAYVHKIVQKEHNKNECELILFPVSLHSIKTDFDDEFPNHKQRISFISQKRAKFKGQNVLIVDDNSSTGRTIEAVYSALKYLRKSKPNSVCVSIAEADLTRSKIDLLSQSRLSIAHHSLYDSSVNTLPVSRKFRPKSDLREILEQRRNIACIRQRYLNQGSSLQRMLIGKAYIDLFKYKTREIVEKKSDTEIIDKFRRTFLSNFSPIEVTYSGKIFESTEHAYQAMKFLPGALESVTESDIHSINHEISEKGFEVQKEDLPFIFTREGIPAGISKRIANKLRRLGHVRVDWDEIKIFVMTDLLILKFSDPTYYEKLNQTKSKYLIEGNDWGDTYWGAVEGRGRNMLGRLLMQIRETDISELQNCRQDITYKSNNGIKN